MQASGQLHALVTSLQGTKSVCFHLVAHLFVIRNHYYDFYFAVLFKVRTQRLCYSCVACPIFALLKPVPVFRYLATVAAVYLDPSGSNSFVVLSGRHHTFYFLSVLKSLWLKVWHNENLLSVCSSQQIFSKLVTRKSTPHPHGAATQCGSWPPHSWGL
jgi:hypothetical protein